MALKFEATVKKEMSPIICRKTVSRLPYLLVITSKKNREIIVGALLCFACTEQMCL